MKNGGSLITLSFYGSQKVMPSYNVMGIAKAALEASVKYLSVDLGDKNKAVDAEYKIALSYVKLSNEDGAIKQFQMIFPKINCLFSRHKCCAY